MNFVRKIKIMKILIAPDSFKGSLTSFEAADAIRAGISEVDATIDTILLPLSDGGEGFLEVIQYNLGGKLQTKKVKNPIFKDIQAGYLIVGDTAYIEIAQAAGLELLTTQEKNPMKTTTYGVGELILDAIEKNVNHIVIGIGGSATNDAGMGMASALGYRFLDKKGDDLYPVGENLLLVDKIDDSHLAFMENDIEVRAFCDVRNPLFGTDGAAFQYAAQKGASSVDVGQLDKGLRHFSVKVRERFGQDFSKIAGAGAAGGLGAGIMAFLEGELVSGIEELMRLTNFEAMLENVDMVITGEGKIDEQTLSGKLVAGIVTKAKSMNVPVIAFCGRVDLDDVEISRLGLKAVYPLQTKLMTEAADFSMAAMNLKKLVSTVFRRLDLLF